MSGLSGALIGYLGGVGDARGAKSKPRPSTRLMPTYSAATTSAPSPASTAWTWSCSWTATACWRWRPALPSW